MSLQGILEIEQDSTQETNTLDSTHSFYPYDSSYPHLASNDKNAGVEELGGERKKQKKIKARLICVLKVVINKE